MTLETRQNENRLFKEVVMNLPPVYGALTAKFDRISPQKLASLDPINSEQLSSLAIALLSFTEMTDFDRWLESNCIEGG
jgi:hypothetical protein